MIKMDCNTVKEMEEAGYDFFDCTEYEISEEDKAHLIKPNCDKACHTKKLGICFFRKKDHDVPYTVTVEFIDNNLNIFKCSATIRAKKVFGQCISKELLEKILQFIGAISTKITFSKIIEIKEYKNPCVGIFDPVAKASYKFTNISSLEEAEKEIRKNLSIARNYDSFSRRIYDK